MRDAPSPSVLYFDPKKSTENFARLCQFLVTICSDVMRDILSHYIKPANLRTELDQNKSKLEKITNKQEKDLLYSPHSSTSSVPPIRSKDLDISLLYKILRNLCNIPTHIAGWGNQPRPSDFSLAACIERIRILRNSISGHSTNGTVDDNEFEDYWIELRTTVVEIEKEVIGSDRYERGIDHLYDCDLNPTKSKEYVAQIRRCTGELKVKRERIDVVEEEAKAKRVRLESLEEKQAILEARFSEIVEGLTAIKSDTCMLKELKTTELRLHQEKETSSFSNCLNDNCSQTITIDTSTCTTNKSTATTIKFKSSSPVSHFSMLVTRDNKCWTLVPNFDPVSFNRSFEKPFVYTLYLLSDVGINKEIKIPEEYASGLYVSNITVNDDGEAVFVSENSLIAAGENGVVRKMFNIPELFTDNCRVCFMLSGNYLVQCSFGTFFQYTKNGDFLGNWTLPLTGTSPNLQHPQSSLYQNSNENFIFTNVDPLANSSHLYILNKDFNLKCTVDMDKVGIITPVFNKAGHLLCGHGQSIDLLDSNGDFVHNICKTNRRTEIIKIAYSKNGTIWILFESSEIDIYKLWDVSLL